jgi:hypothetical protein
MNLPASVYIARDSTGMRPSVSQANVMYSINPAGEAVVRRGEGGARMEDGSRRDMVDAYDELTAHVHRVGKVLVVLVSIMCALGLCAFAVGIVAFATRPTAAAGAFAAGGARYAGAAGRPLDPPSSCMTDAQLQNYDYYVVNAKATHGAVYTVRAASTVRLPVTTSSCGSALLVRSLDPTYDVMLVDTSAVLMTKEQSLQMVTLLMKE